MGYFLTKLAAKAEENERTVGGTARGAALGVLGAGALGGAAYGGTIGANKLFEALGNRNLKAINTMTASQAAKVKNKVKDMRLAGKSQAEIKDYVDRMAKKTQDRAIRLSSKADRNLGRSLKAEAASDAMKNFAKKNWKWGVPVALGAGALGGGLLLND